MDYGMSSGDATSPDTALAQSNRALRDDKASEKLPAARQGTQERTSDGMERHWGKIKADPALYKVWHDAMMLGVNHFHADKSRHDAWREALAEGMKRMGAWDDGSPRDLDAVVSSMPKN